MNPNNTIEYNSLSWVKTQLDAVLTDAQSNLNDYIENKTDEQLENCIEHLQLIYGTLQMIEVYGAAMLAEEMKLTTLALLEGRVESAYDAYDVLMRAMLQLPDYLEGVQAGKADAPITLMPIINDLRVVRKESLLTEGILFSPDIENTVVVSDAYEIDSIDSGGLQGEVKRLRTHYQLGLLDYIQNSKERVGLQRIKAVLNSLEKVSANAEVRNIWIVVGALVEGLVNKGIEKNISINKLLSTVDRQLKLILDVGEDEFLNQYSKELVKNTLYYVGASIPVRIVLAIGMAMLLNQGLAGTGALRTIFYLPSVTAGVAIAILWRWVYHPNYGAFNNILSLFGIQGPTWLGDSAWAMPAIIIMGIWLVSGRYMVIFLAGLQGIPDQLYEAARIDGAGRIQQFRHVTVPLLSPTIYLVGVLGVIQSFQVFSFAYILTEGGPADATLVYILYLYRKGFQYFQMGYACSLAWVLFLIIMGVTLVQKKLSSWVYYESGD